MAAFYRIGLIFVTVIAFVCSLLGFLGKDIILDTTYTNASEEDRKKMNKKAYRLQGATIFLSISLMTLCSFLRMVTHVVWFTYFAYIIAVIGIVYAIISHYSLKKQAQKPAA